MRIENVDCYFTIAKQHLICEDYALAGTEPFPHLIVCDGCSSSVRTDVGARIVAASAQKTLRDHAAAYPGTLPSYTDFGYATIHRARHVAELLDLPATCLDATLLIAMPVQDEVHVYLYGDGYVATVNQQGALTFTQIAYSGNMPYYLSYWGDLPRKAGYVAVQQGGQEALTITTYQDGQAETRAQPYDTPVELTFAMPDATLVALMSDGVASFMAVEQNTKIPTRDVIAQLVSYKTTKGDFVKRRARRMIKEYEKQGIAPTDDVSIATLLISH